MNNLSKFLVSTCGLLAAAGAMPLQAQTQVQIDPANGGQTHNLQSVNYSMSGPGPVLTVRTVRPITCAPVGDEPNESVRSVVMDPNGYLPPYSVAGRSAPMQIGLTNGFPEWAEFRTADRVAFGDMLYPVDPVSAANRVAVGGIDGNCQPGNPTPVTPVPVPACEVIEDDFEIADRIARHGFEAGGSVQLYSRVVANTPTSVFYEHIVTASGGPVSGVKLRELFPYHPAAPGQSSFKTSLDIESAWVCRASAGAQCGSRARSDAGMGYAHLDAASLESGQCLKVVAVRNVVMTGDVDSDFSGTIHSALFAPAQGGSGAPSTTIKRSRIDLD